MISRPNKDSLFYQMSTEHELFQEMCGYYAINNVITTPHHTATQASELFQEMEDEGGSKNVSRSSFCEKLEECLIKLATGVFLALKVGEYLETVVFRFAF